MGNDLSVGYRGQDVPISIGSTFINRVQDVEFSRTIPSRPVDELGTESHVGYIQDVYQYRARITRIGIEDGIEAMLSGKTSPVSLSDFISASGVTIKGPHGGITGAKVTNIVFEATAGSDPPQETWTLEGTGWTSGSIASSSDPTAIPSGADCSVSFGGTVSRVQRVRVTADLNRNVAMELGNASPVGYAYDPPTVSVEFEILHHSAALDYWNPDQTSPSDLVVTINDKTLTVSQAVSEGQVGRGNVRGWATSVYRFVSKDGGLSIAWT